MSVVSHCCVLSRLCQDDFLLLVGYCGWGEGQLQGELNNQDTWTMASVDPKQLLGQLRQEQAELRRRKPGAMGPHGAMVLGEKIAPLPSFHWAIGNDVLKFFSIGKAVFEVDLEIDQPPFG